MKCLNEVATITVLSNVFKFWKQRNGEFRAGGRAVDLKEPKFEIKYRSRCLQKSKLVDWGGGGGQGSASPIDPTILPISQSLYHVIGNCDKILQISWLLNKKGSKLKR